MFAPSRSPTAMWMARSPSRRPQPDSGSACSQSLLWGDVNDSSRALSVALLRLLLISVCLSIIIIIVIIINSLTADETFTPPHLSGNSELFPQCIFPKVFIYSLPTPDLAVGLPSKVRNLKIGSRDQHTLIIVSYLPR